nr:MAG TPA: hypothetical protein [Bacteriophage sp.]
MMERKNLLYTHKYRRTIKENYRISEIRQLKEP